MATTKIENLIKPQVMADMISAKVEKKIVVAPFARVDQTLEGIPGNKITVPKYAYIGDAEDVAEGVECGTAQLTTTTTEAEIKKAMKAVELTDEAVLSGYGNPIGEANNQLALSIAAKIDNDAMDALQDAQVVFNGSGSNVSYDGIVDAVDLFEEEVNCEKVMFVHPKQVTQLRHDADFISADKYPGNVMMTGEIGIIANTRIVPSKKVPKNAADEYIITTSEPADWSSKFKSYFTKSGSSYSAVTGTNAPEWSEGTYYAKIAAGAAYSNPIVKLTCDAETEDESPALTIYLKRDTNVEAERKTLARKTDISADKFYTVALSNSSKVVLAKFKA